MEKNEEQFEEDAQEIEEFPFDSIVPIEAAVYQRCENLAVRMRIKTSSLIQMMILNGLLELEGKEAE